MLYGRSVISWLVLAAIAIAVFVIFAWLIPFAFSYVLGVTIPVTVGRALAFLVAIAAFYGGYSRIGVPA